MDRSLVESFFSFGRMSADDRTKADIAAFFAPPESRMRVVVEAQEIPCAWRSPAAGLEHEAAAS